MIERRFLKISEAAEYLSIGRSTAYRLMYAGKLPAVRIGGAVRIDRKALDLELEKAKAGHGRAL